MTMEHDDHGASPRAPGVALHCLVTLPSRRPACDHPGRMNEEVRDRKPRTNDSRLKTMKTRTPLQIGCAGWSLPRTQADGFPVAGSHLQRYSARLPAVEINSSFYRPHRPQTYARWADVVPAGFRFAVKLPRTITHEQRLRPPDGPLREFLAQVGALGEQLGVVLVQLPPSLRFEPAAAGGFFATLRDQFDGAVACEPRHASWFGDAPETLLREMRVARVAADPALSPTAAKPGGWRGLVYHRLHGTPRVYYSNYAENYLAELADQLMSEAADAPVWCIFDNTAEGHAVANARRLLTMCNGPGK